MALHLDFLFSETHVEVISGKQEGVYAWVAINYVLRNFDHSSSGTASHFAPAIYATCVTSSFQQMRSRSK